MPKAKVLVRNGFSIMSEQGRKSHKNVNPLILLKNKRPRWRETRYPWALAKKHRLDHKLVEPICQKTKIDIFDRLDVSTNTFHRGNYK